MGIVAAQSRYAFAGSAEVLHRIADTSRSARQGFSCGRACDASHTSITAEQEAQGFQAMSSFGLPGVAKRQSVVSSQIAQIRALRLPRDIDRKYEGT